MLRNASRATMFVIVTAALIVVPVAIRAGCQDGGCFAHESECPEDSDGMTCKDADAECNDSKCDCNQTGKSCSCCKK